MRNSSAVSVSAASAASVPPFSLTRTLSMMPRLGLARMGRMPGYGVSRVIVTVCGSGASTAVIFSTRKSGFDCRLRTRSKDHLTSAEVRGFPLAKVTSGCRVNV